MSKVARNALCPCGSGKKYKHCCGNNVVSIHEIVDQEVEQHMHDFIRYAAFEHESFLYENTKAYINKKERDEDTLIIFRFFISTWVMFFKKDIRGMTLLDYYLSTIRKRDVRPSVLSILTSWKEAFPSFMQIDHIDGPLALGTDLITGETKQIKFLDQHVDYELKIGQVITCIFVPHGIYTTCFSTFFPMPTVAPNALKHFVQTYWEQCNKDIKQWTEQYPYIFQQSLSITLIDTGELSPKHQEVLTILEQKANIDDMSAMDTVRIIWRQYCRTKNPNIRKPEVYAAALHYILLETALQEEWMPQKQLANMYGVSASTLSKRIDDLYMALEDLDLDLEEQLDELAEELGVDEEWDDWEEDDWDDGDIFEVCEDCDEE
ncbi:XRE family transcriptional regulator [Anoxybacillus flavithermus NBRC 109594]|uniref:XRE family transcriptional regulator n=1 Tax=Anoxybacillus flavithermus NBRC 109594 TaxID=1315967 RepID=R4FAQ4_9BACL|nr:SEC-C metal-binding domain-containing protein [Anoxybacillus flavithermus]GAC90591.1 XRE family transcriptional regulator [Anoxybacillus flavithermus NBRC 109594]